MKRFMPVETALECATDKQLREEVNRRFPQNVAVWIDPRNNEIGVAWAGGRFNAIGLLDQGRDLAKCKTEEEAQNAPQDTDSDGKSA